MFPAESRSRHRFTEDDELDCGLYCEAHSICDFFVHDGRGPCYLGTFQSLKRNGSYLETETDGGKYGRGFYIVYKSELF